MYLIIYLALVIISFIVITLVTREVRTPSLFLNMGGRNKVMDGKEISYLEWYYVLLLSLFFPVTILFFLIEKLHDFLVHFNA